MLRRDARGRTHGALPALRRARCAGSAPAVAAAYDPAADGNPLSFAHGIRSFWCDPYTLRKSRINATCRADSRHAPAVVLIVAVSVRDQLARTSSGRRPKSPAPAIIHHHRRAAFASRTSPSSAACLLLRPSRQDLGACRGSRSARAPLAVRARPGRRRRRPLDLRSPQELAFRFVMVRSARIVRPVSGGARAVVGACSAGSGPRHRDGTQADALRREDLARVGNLDGPRLGTASISSCSCQCQPACDPVGAVANVVFMRLARPPAEEKASGGGGKRQGT